MSFIENVINECKPMESLLRAHFGATGYGLGQMARSAEDNLDADLIRRIKKIARIRNRLAHEADYSHGEEHQPGFLKECQSVHARLQSLVSDERADEESNEGDEVDDELDPTREEAIASIGDTLENIEAHRQTLAEISGALEDGFLIVINANNLPLEIQVESDLIDDDEQSHRISLEPYGIASIIDEATLTIKTKRKGRTKVETSQFSVDSETCLFYRISLDGEGLVSIDPDPSCLERLLKTFSPD
ncbi:hypothetical protein [uncultured Sphaerotilus sp.]|uniref:hypothetical protein n=1 Tax=uncultured Sphaerotilus sp. TaxID=474984 RepID=UPI0030CA4279